MVSIRLKRVGKKGHVVFRFVVSDKRKDTIGPALETLGSYDPHQNPSAIQVKAERVQYWLSKGAQPSATVHNLLVTAGVIKAAKVVIVKAKKSVKDGSASGGKEEPLPKADSPVAKKAETKPEVKAEVKVEDPAKPDPATPEKKPEEPAKS